MRIFDYVKRNKKSFKEVKFNELDALVFASLSYINFKNILDKKKLTIKEAYQKLEHNESVFALDRFNYQNVLLLKALSESPRFENVYVEKYERKTTRTCQFAALMIKVPHYLTFISYEGTEDDFDGWEEDGRFSYEFPTDAQKYAYRYLLKYLKNCNKTLYIGGHSKGGNLAISAMIHAKFLTRFRVKAIYNFDGPGFLPETIESKKYKRIVKKIKSYYPEESVVGMMLENLGDKKIVKSSYKKVQQHNSYSWWVDDNEFVTGKLSKYSIKWHNRTIKICNTYSKAERELFVTTFFNLLRESGYNKKSEFDKISIKKMMNMLKNLKNLNKNEKEILFGMFKLLLIEQ